MLQEVLAVSVSSTHPPLSRRGRPACAMTVAIGVLIITTAMAQPELPAHWFQQRGPAADGEAISFCVDPRDPGHIVDADIAEAIASALLVNVRLHVVTSSTVVDDFEDLYIELVEHCAVYLGFKLFADTYPGWLTITRPFYESRFVVLAADPSWSTLADIPLDVPIGVVQGTMGDIRFLRSNNDLPADQRRRRVPLGRPNLAFDALMDGRVGALVVWEPWWWWLQFERPELAELHVVSAPHVSEPAIGVGGVLLADRTFVRSAVDEALAAIDDDVQRILEDRAYPGVVHGR